MEDKIKEYVSSVLTTPNQNVYELADNIFGKNPLVTDSGQKIVIDELAGIQQVKRNVMIEIVRKKTGINIASAKDEFMNNTVILVDNTNS